MSPSDSLTRPAPARELRDRVLKEINSGGDPLLIEGAARYDVARQIGFSAEGMERFFPGPHRFDGEITRRRHPPS